MIKGEDLGIMYRPPLNPKLVEKQRRMKRLAMIKAIQNEKIIEVIVKEEPEKPVKTVNEIISPFTPKGEKIAKRICNALNVSFSDVQGPRRFKNIVLARFAIYYWIRRLTDYSYPQIVQVLGRKDHTAALHGAREYIKIRAKMGRNLPELTKFKHKQ